MKRYWLIIKVSIVNVLQHFHLLPMIWYKCQIDLGKLEGKRLFEAIWNKEDDWK